MKHSQKYYLMRYQKIHDKHKKLVFFDNVELSLWAKIGMDEYTSSDILGNIEPQKEVVEIFMKTVMESG